MGPYSGTGHLHFCSPQPDTILCCETIDTALVHCLVCFFTWQFLPVPIYSAWWWGHVSTNDLPTHFAATPWLGIELATSWFTPYHCSESCLWVYFVWPDPTKPTSWLTQPNGTHYKWQNLDPTRPDPLQLTNLTVWCNQILSNRALIALT